MIVIFEKFRQKSKGLNDSALSLNRPKIKIPTFMSHKIFLSYRRSDTAGTTGRLHDYLSDALGAETVFKDVQDIPAGVKFTEVLREELQKCSIILVMIGKDYTSIKDDDGNLRLHDPNDFVQIEVASALNSDKIVIPVLVNGASMPSADDLPDNLKELVEYNAVVISHDRWKSDVEVLLRKLKHHIGPSEKTKKTVEQPKPAAPAATSASNNSWVRPAIIGGVALLVVVFLLSQFMGDDAGEFDDTYPAEEVMTQGGEDTTPPAPASYDQMLVGMWNCFTYGEETSEEASLFTDVYYDTGELYWGREEIDLDYELEGDVLTLFVGEQVYLTVEILSMSPNKMELRFADENGNPVTAYYEKIINPN